MVDAHEPEGSLTMANPTSTHGLREGLSDTPPHRPSDRLAGETVVITGAGSGVGPRRPASSTPRAPTSS